MNKKEFNKCEECGYLHNCHKEGCLKVDSEFTINLSAKELINAQKIMRQVNKEKDKLKSKTLKDLKATEWTEEHTKKLEDWVKVLDLRQEAIKWIKHFNELANNTRGLGLSNYYKGKADGIKEFNNVTEEDLK